MPSPDLPRKTLRAQGAEIHERWMRDLRARRAALTNEEDSDE